MRNRENTFALASGLKKDAACKREIRSKHSRRRHCRSASRSRSVDARENALKTMLGLAHRTVQSLRAEEKEAKQPDGLPAAKQEAKRCRERLSPTHRQSARIPKRAGVAEGS